MPPPITPTSLPSSTETPAAVSDLTILAAAVRTADELPIVGRMMQAGAFESHSALVRAALYHFAKQLGVDVRLEHFNAGGDVAIELDRELLRAPRRPRRRS